MADHIKASFDATRQEIHKTNQNVQNIQATMKDLQQQIGQLTLQFSGREPGKFPSQIVPNPRGTVDCSAIRILRSGKGYDNRDAENSARASQAAHVHPQTGSESSTESAQSLDKSENTVVPVAEKSERVYVPDIKMASILSSYRH